MSTNNRTCLCCGKKYKFCPKCNRENNGYNTNFDTKECAELFNAVSGYNMKISNVNAINKVLNIYNISDFSKYVDSISSVLYELFPRIDKKPNVTTEEKEPINTDNSVKNRFSKKNKSYQKKEVELSDKTDNDKELKVKNNKGISEDE